MLDPLDDYLDDDESVTYHGQKIIWDHQLTPEQKAAQNEALAKWLYTARGLAKLRKRHSQENN